MAKDPGREFEDHVAELIGGEVVPNSGQGRYAKMDARGLGIVWSCKWTKHLSRSITPVEFAEVERAVHGPGGYGDQTLPGMAIGMDDFVVFAMEPKYFMDFVTREAPTVQVGKAEARRIHANDTPLMRGEGDA